jgi:acylphosphatase
MSQIEEKSTPSQARLHAIIHGRVQGVSFRYYTAQTANRLGLTGWVANRWDGSVETVAEGPRKALGDFLTFLHRGPPSAMVTKVDESWLLPTGEFKDFGVRFI